MPMVQALYLYMAQTLFLSMTMKLNNVLAVFQQLSARELSQIRMLRGLFLTPSLVTS